MIIEGPHLFPGRTVGLGAAETAGHLTIIHKMELGDWWYAIPRAGHERYQDDGTYDD